MRGRARGILAAAALTLAIVPVATGAAPSKAAGAAASSARAVADTYVSAAKKRTNYGRARKLLVGGRARARAYLRFAAPPAAHGGQQTALLRLFATKAGGKVTVRAVPSTRWSERRLTFRNAPRLGAKIATIKPLGQGWMDVDVTHLLHGRPNAFALTGGGSGAAFSSREGGHAPELAVTTTASMIAVGDIAGCDTTGDEQTAALVSTLPGTVAVLGDNAYETGSAAEYANCYAPSWGPFKARTKPSAGNHDYETPGAAGYYGYFGAAAAPPLGYYSYDLGAWHVVVLNSNCDFVSCAAGSAQERWLQSDLASHRARCTLAYWHHPRFSSGQVTSDSMTLPFWTDLYNAGADVVLTGHAHNYQRYAPQSPSGAGDPSKGIREFVVGTGGRSHHPVTPLITNEEVANATTYGVLRLSLNDGGYSWNFIPVAGGQFSDSGSAACH